MEYRIAGCNDKMAVHPYGNEIVGVKSRMAKKILRLTLIRLN